MVLKIVMLGPPASGKGTVASKIVARLGVVHVSTGDLLRNEINNQTVIGLEIADMMGGGKLVPDEVIIALVRKRLSQRDCLNFGWLLDGFPRTAAQAEALLDCGLVRRTGDPNLIVIRLDVPAAALIGRITGRRIDRVTGRSYNTSSPDRMPKDPAVLARLEQRKDDNAPTFARRLKAFDQHIVRILDTFADRRVHTFVCACDAAHPNDGSVIERAVASILNTFSSKDTAFDDVYRRDITYDRVTSSSGDDGRGGDGRDSRGKAPHPLYALAYRKRVRSKM